MRNFILLVIFFANQALSFPNITPESPTNGKHRALRVYNNKIFLLLTKSICIWPMFHIPCHLFYPVENNDLFEAMNDCGIGHLYTQFRDNQISRDNLWLVTEEMMAKMNITMNDQLTYQRKKKECNGKGTKFITLLDYWIIERIQ